MVFSRILLPQSSITNNIIKEAAKSLSRTMLIRLMKAAIAAVFRNKMIRGFIIGLAVRSMKRTASPATISALKHFLQCCHHLSKSRK